MESHACVADLVLEGGGVKGIALAGAVSALYDKGYRVGAPARVAGTSAGAIVGSLLAADMPVTRLVDAMRALDYRRFKDSPSFGVLGRGVSLLTRLGLYRGDYLHRWISGQLAACGVRTFVPPARRSGQRPAARAGVQAGGRRVRRDQRPHGPAAVGLPAVRPGSRHAARGRRRTGIGVDSVLLPAGRAHDAGGRSRGGLRRRGDAVQLSHPHLRPDER